MPQPGPGTPTARLPRSMGLPIPPPFPNAPSARCLAGARSPSPSPRAPATTTPPPEESPQTSPPPVTSADSYVFTDAAGIEARITIEGEGAVLTVTNDTGGGAASRRACTCSMRATGRASIGPCSTPRAVPEGESEWQVERPAGARGQAHRPRRDAVRRRGLRRVRAAATGRRVMRSGRALVSVVVALTAVVALVAAPGTGASAPVAAGLSQTQALRAQLEATACDVPTELLVRSWRGHRADRSGDIDIIPQEPDFVGTRRAAALGAVGLRRPGAAAGSTGPGHIQARGEVDRVVTLADIAPTQGALVGFPFDAPDGAAAAPRRSCPAPTRRSWWSWWSGTARGRVRARRVAEGLAEPAGLDRRGHVVRGRRGGVLAAEHGADPRHDRHRGVLAQPRPRRAPAAHRRPAHRPVGSRPALPRSRPPSPTCTTGRWATGRSSAPSRPSRSTSA